MTQDNREKFIYLSGLYGQRVEFHNVEEKCADKIAEIRKAFPQVDKTRYTLNTFYRMMFSFVVSAEIEKGIFLDADIIVNLDIKELWQYELGDKVFGVVSEKELGEHPELKDICKDGHVKAENYFNAGVLLMNLKLLRKSEEILIHGIKFILENPLYRNLVDQNVLNYCFSSRILKLPIKFNQMIYCCYRRKEVTVTSGIYHFAGVNDPNLRNIPFSRLWLKYFMKTSWFNEDAVNRLYEGFLKVRNDLQTRMARLSAIISGKKRAFFVEPSKIDSMKKFFLIRDDEEIIPAENEESLQKLIDSMKASKDKCVFFIMMPKFLNKNFPFDLLTKEGFVLDKDFVRGWTILLDVYGNPFNSAPLIKAM